MGLCGPGFIFIDIKIKQSLFVITLFCFGYYYFLIEVYQISSLCFGVFYAYSFDRMKKKGIGLRLNVRRVVTI